MNNMIDFAFPYLLQVISLAAGSLISSMCLFASYEQANLFLLLGHHTWKLEVYA